MFKTAQACLHFRIGKVAAFVFGWQVENRSPFVVDATLILLKPGIQGGAKPTSMVTCKPKDHTVEGAGVSLASSLHPSGDLEIGCHQ